MNNFFVLIKMNDILKKTDCCGDQTHYHEDVSKIMHVLLSMECENPDSKLHRLFTNKFTSIKDKFFISSRFKDVDQWKLQLMSIYNCTKYNLIICSLLWGGSYTCPFKNKRKEYDGYDYGNEDIIIYNKTTHDYVIMNTWHIHAMYYHNYLGNEKFKIDLENLQKVLQNIPNLKMDIIYKNKLVYDDVLCICTNEVEHLKNIKPALIAEFQKDCVLIVWLVKSTENDANQYKKMLNSGLIAHKKTGEPIFDKDLLYIFIMDKNKKNNYQKNLSAYDINAIKILIYTKLNIIVINERSTYRYGLVNRCYPIMKDFYSYKFEEIQ